MPKTLRLTPSSIAITVLCALIWLLAFRLREEVIELRCIVDTSYCQLESVFWLDRVLFVSEIEEAHLLSFKTQNATGAFALVAVLAFAIASAVRKRRDWIKRILTDSFLLLQAAVVTGALCEVVRVLVQRPRPHVYKHPLLAGDNPAHYTSFFSGHTSFAAASVSAMVFVLLARGVPRPLVLGLAFVGSVGVIWTGYLRMISGRHFFTDVLVGALAGAACAYWVVKRTSRSA